MLRPDQCLDCGAPATMHPEGPRCPACYYLLLIKKREKYATSMEEESLKAKRLN
jgi:DNA-directed RNA polymerase subunit RPC12/RpoP